MKRVSVLLATFLCLPACQSVESELPAGAAAYTKFPSADTASRRTGYLVGQQDILSVRTFQEPELSFETLRVDSSGAIPFPLIGDVDVEGRTNTEIAREIERRLGSSYIVNPQVLVAVSESASNLVVVEGSVKKPGAFQISGSATLLEAIARAESPVETAALDEVVVFRVVDGQREGAVFDLREIRAGNVPDPQILGGDTIVVGYSEIKGAFRQFLQAAPLLNLFRAF